MKKAALGFIALAMSFMATTALAYNNEGDIRSIDRCDRDGNVLSPMADGEYAIAGDTVCFRIRLENVLSEFYADPGYRNPWRLYNTVKGEFVTDYANSGATIGVFVSGEFRQAKIVDVKTPTSVDTKNGATSNPSCLPCYTDIVCAYTVQPGDFAFPMTLANSLKGDVIAAGGYYWLNPDFKLRAREYSVQPPWDDSSAYSWVDGNLTFKTGSPSYPTSEISFWSSDIGLNEANISIKTLDFVESEVFMDEGDPRIIDVKFHGGTNSVGGIAYLKVKNDSKFDLVRTGAASVSIKEMEGPDGVAEYQCLKVEIPAGVSSFQVKVLGKEDGAEGVLYLSSTESFVKDKNGDHKKNYITAAVKCGPPKRRVSVEINPADLTLTNGVTKAVVTPSPDYATALRRLTVKLSTAYTSDVEVKIDASLESATASGNPVVGKYIGLSSRAVDGYLGNENTVTFTVDEMNRGILSKDLYVYVLGGDDETAGTGNGIRFKPSVNDAAAEAFYNEEPITSVLMIDKSVPQIIEPVAGHRYENIPGGVEYTFEIKVADGYNDIGGEYEIEWKKRTNDSNASVSFENGVKKPNTEGYLYVKVKYNHQEDDYNSRFRLKNASGSYSDWRTISVQVDPAKQAYAVVEGFEDEFEFDEIDDEGDDNVLYVRFHLNVSNEDTIYAFLVPLDEASSNKVEFVKGKGKESGIAIPGGTTNSVQTAELRLLDGCDDTLPVSYRIELRTGRNPDSELFEGAYECKDLELYVNNVYPVINSVGMSGSHDVTKSGDTFNGKASVGLQKVFTLDVIDSEVDWLGDAYAVWTFADPNGYVGDPVKYEGPLCDACATNTFTVAGTYTCNVKVQDKDLLGGRRHSETFEFKVIVGDTPTVLIEFPLSDTYQEDAIRDAYFNVKLSTPATKPLVVDLVCTPAASGSMVLSEASLEFKPGEISKKVMLTDLDGTPDASSLKGGFAVSASVTTTAENEDGQKYCDVYEKANENIYIVNVNPVIELPIPDLGITNSASIEVDYPVSWRVSDVDADMQTIKVTWTSNEAGAGDTIVTGQSTGVYVARFKSGGMKTLTMQVEDKDGGISVARYYYYVTPSKMVYVHPYGPYRSGPLSQISGQYAEASGRGEGRVWSDGTVNVTDFEHKYRFGTSDTTAKLYAWGYKNGQSDNGYLWSKDMPWGSNTHRDHPVGANGNLKAASGSPENTNGYYVYSDKSGRDSFFYAWVLCTKGEDSAVFVGTPLVAPLNPAAGDVAANYSLALPLEATDDEINPVFQDSFVEAFFAKEKYASDNMGDMNGDGIPDYFATKSWTDPSGVLKTLPEAQTGQSISGSAGDAGSSSYPPDLAAVDGYNGDADFLPAAWGSANPLNPQTKNWGPGQKFTAIREIRGFGNGLNEPGVSDYDLTEAETNALFAAYAAAGETNFTYAAATNWATRAGWTPEAINPGTGTRLNPIHPDTDGDEFNDGWEYYFWYYAKIGAMVDGKWGRLEGRRLDIDGSSSRITPEEIAQAFDPHAARDMGGRFGMDFDNDGLTDLEEYVLGTNPCDWDSDGDGASDLWEVMMGVDPCFADVDSNPDRDFMARLDYQSDTFTLYAFANGEMYALPSATASAPAVEAAGTAQEVFKVEVADADATVAYWSLQKPAVYSLEDGSTKLASDLECYTTLTLDTDYLGALTCLSAGTVVTVADQPEQKTSGKATGFSWIDPGTQEKGTTTTALKVFNYGGDGATYVPCASGITAYAEIPSDSELVEVRKKVTITLIHDQVYTHEGFDPRVAWNIDEYGLLGTRWKNPNAEEAGGYGDAGRPMNTVAYTTRDEYLLLQYRRQVLPDDYETGVGSYVDIFRAHTTYPNLPISFIDADKLSYKPFTFTNTTVMAYWDSLRASSDTNAGVGQNSTDIHGADTDSDGVPDGWELYVGTNPLDELDGGWHIDSDVLSLAQEFAGVDSCSAYTNRYMGTMLVYPEVYSITKNHPGKTSSWWNKLFPTDPRSNDTDGDGLADDKERGKWSGTFYVGNNEYPASFSFMYREYEHDTGAVCFRGGGLNPCTVDTDGDLLPDPWEYEFAGILKTGDSYSISPPARLSNADRKSLEVGFAYRDMATNTVAHIRGGMDGTFAGDANHDYDNDGLANFQEYLVQTLRHLRYDDSLTPLMGVDPTTKKFVRFIPFSAWDGSAFHKKCTENGFTGSGAWQFSKLGYFALPPHSWDLLVYSGSSCDNYAHSEGAGYRIMFPPSAVVPLVGTINASGYACTDPRRIDTDNDGMDDFYELFHGLNPLLGSAADPLSITPDGSTSCQRYDVIARLYWGRVNAWANHWTGWTSVGQPAFDAIRHPWMIGTMECDADGDGMRNDEESIKVNLALPRNTHTDPTPLWMTDSTSVRFASFTSQYYLPDPYIAETPNYVEGSTQPDIFRYPWTDFSSTTRSLILYAAEGDDVAAEVLRQGTGGMDRRWMFSFEENEGYDTDRDFRPDADEMTGTTEPTSDPLNYMDVNRRQALYLPGIESAAVSYDSESRREVGSEPDMLKQFTVECWICPEEVVADSVILERVSVYGPSTLSNDQTYVRANFRLGIDAEGRVYGEYEGSTPDYGANRVTCAQYRPQPGTWMHLALAYDGSTLAMYVNGELSPVEYSSNTRQLPANGVDGVLQYPNGAVVPYEGYRALPCANIIGARAKTKNAISIDEETQWTDFANHYKGWIDEIRVWDGARMPADIRADYKKRYSFDDVAKNREAVYMLWKNGGTRANGNLPPEILFHYNFVTLPGGVTAGNVLKTPVGFESKVLDNVRKNGEDIYESLVVGWWSSLGVRSNVYSPMYVPWMPNTVAHMPMFDGSTADSRYWSSWSAGVVDMMTPYDYPNTCNPYVDYVYRYEKFNRLIQLFFMEQYSVTNMNVNVNGAFEKYKFQLRSDFVGSSDLVPLGGAFARRSTNFWDGAGAMDAWVLTAKNEYTPADSDGDGIPDWAEKLGFTDKEEYLRALAAGLLPDATAKDDVNGLYVDKADSNHDGLLDWWQRLYDLKGIASEDSDMDGLADFAEYLVSDKFKFANVSPVKTRTNGSEFDYFLKRGKLYLGEMFSDHDFMEDWWEALYPDTVVDSAKYDPLGDSDLDGWSNYAECRAGTMPNRTSTIVIDSDEYLEYPVPLITANVYYSKADQTAAPVVINAYSRRSSSKPDATWVLSGTAEEKEYEIALGLNPGRKHTGNIGRNVVPGTVRVSLSHPADYGDGLGYSGAWYGLLFERPNPGTDTADLILYTIDGLTGDRVGTVNYYTGDYEIDFSLLTQNVSCNSDKQVVTGFVNDGSGFDLKSSYFKIAWKSIRPPSSMPWQFKLTKTESGHVREGLNTFEVYLDLDNSGTYSLGEPHGFVRGVDVKWNSCSFDVELKDISSALPRVDLGMGDDPLALSRLTQVNVTRVAIDGISSSANGIIVNPKLKGFDIGTRGYIYECDMMGANEFDLDWERFPTDVMKSSMVKNGYLQVTSVTYRVEVRTKSDVSDLAVSNTFDLVRRFTGVHHAPTPVNVNAVNYGARPVFRWKYDSAVSQDDWDTFTSFSVQVKQGSAAIWNSGVRMLPPRLPGGEFEWVAPICVNDLLSEGKMFANTNNYTWAVSLHNSKFQTATWSAEQSFRMNVYGENEPNATGYGVANLRVKYFGPASFNTSMKIKGAVRVEAYPTPDFTGYPLGATVVGSSAHLTDSVYGADAVNATIIGLESGTYYVCAYIDSNGNRKRDAFESWGYVCPRGDTVTKAIFNPLAIKVGDGLAVEETLYIEDVDTDQDCLPDVWEYDQAQGVDGFLAKKNPSANTHNGYISVNPELAAAINNMLSGSTTAYMLSAGLASLPSDIVALSLGIDTAENTIEASTVAVRAISLADGAVNLTIGAKANEPDLGKLYVKDNTVTATIVVWSAASLDGEWTPSYPITKTFTIEDDDVNDVFTFSLEELGLDTSKKGFFKVELK